MDERVIKNLLRSEAYPEPTKTVNLVQTHVSYIFITDIYAYKVKKPVDLGFLNFSTIDRRRFYCNEEIRLNRRLCPDMYIGVVELLLTSEGAAFHGDGEIVDYAVKMKRLPHERMLDRLLDEGMVTEREIREIARTIARFHLEADSGNSIIKHGTLSAIQENWEENFRQAEYFVGNTIQGKDLILIRKHVENFLAENASLFSRRVEEGFIRDCDGDIHLENICLTDKVYIFDCIEFSDRFRCSDTAADIAFFLMDLDFHEKETFAAPFMDEYSKVTGDDGFMEVLDFYKIYRAFVRGKVESFKTVEPEIPGGERSCAARKAERYFRLARGYVLRKRMPHSLLITCGVMGSGKSAIAAALSFELGMTVFSSDVVRKEITGTPRTGHLREEYGKGIYSRETDETVYQRLLSLCEDALDAGKSVIIDATFRRRPDRDSFARLALGKGVFFLTVFLFCPESIAKERLDTRRLDPACWSDGRWELFRQQNEEFEKPESGAEMFVKLDTSRPMGDNINSVLRALEIHDAA